MPRVKLFFEPGGRRTSASPKNNLLAVAQRIGIRLRSECRGKVLVENV